jgi:hypothetical protein
MRKTTGLTAMAGLAALLFLGGVTASLAAAPASSGAPLAQIPAETSPLVKVGYGWRGYYGYGGYGSRHYGHRGYGHHRYGHRGYGHRYGYGYGRYGHYQRHYW